MSPMGLKSAPASPGRRALPSRCISAVVPVWGVVTKPGLEIAVGRPAINPGPQRMIREAVTRVLTEHGLSGRVEVEVFVPEGEALARKTLNARLGIVGGISILGTTGIVRPMSHEAYTATIRAGLSVAQAVGLKRAVLTTGRRSERYAQLRWPRLPEEAFVQIGDYFAAAMQMAADQAFESVMLAVFFRQGSQNGPGYPPHSCPVGRVDYGSVGPVDAGFRRGCGSRPKGGRRQHGPAGVRPGHDRLPCADRKGRAKNHRNGQRIW